MENSPSDSGSFKIEDDNQILILLKNTFYSTFNVVFNFAIVAIHYFSLPAVLTYRFLAHAHEQLWKITQHVASEFSELMQIVPLSIEACFWSARCLFELLFISKSSKAFSTEVEQNIYVPLKKILQLLHALPFSRNHASALYSVMIKLPIFGQDRLPFPNFLFEDTFTKIEFQKGTISMTITVPQDSSQSAIENTEIATSSQTSTATGQTKSILKNKPTTKSDDKVKPDLSSDQRLSEIGKNSKSL